MFCGFLVVWMAYGTLGYAVLWLPYILAGISEYVRTGRVLYGVLVALTLALSFVSGHFQMSAYVAIVSFLYTLFLTAQEHSWRENIAVFGWLILGLLLISPQLLITFEAYSQSVRSQSLGAGSIPWTYLLTLFAPDVYGNPVTRNDWFGQYAEFASYIGIIPLFLSIYGAVYAHKKRLVFYLVLVVVTVLFCNYISI